MAEYLMREVSVPLWAIYLLVAMVALDGFVSSYFRRRSSQHFDHVAEIADEALRQLQEREDRAVNSK